MQGVISKVDTSKGTYEIFGKGRTHNIDPAEKAVTACAKRTESEILSQLMSVFGGLSPENLTCDGEASRTHIRAASARLNRAKKALCKELGRTPSEDECYREWRAAS